MALTKCKECKKEVSTSAKACPHCGARDSSFKASDLLLGLIGMAVVVSIAMVACGDEKKPEVSVEQPALSAAPLQSEQSISLVDAVPHLGFDSNEFRVRFNALATGSDGDLTLPALEITKGRLRNTWSAKLAGNLLVAALNKETGIIESIVVNVDTSDGEKSGMAFAVLNRIGNALTQNEHRAEVSDVLLSTVRQAAKNMEKIGEPAVGENVRSIRISSIAGAGIGLVVTFSPAQ